MGLKERLAEVEDMLNWVSDQDREWWPFLFLRPEQHERMGTRRVAALATLQGVFAGMLANLFIALLASDHQLNVFILPLCTTLGFFLFYRYTFAYSWNRRAKRLIAEIPAE